MEPGLLIAYLALGVMAVVPIHLGSHASLKPLPRELRAHKDDGFSSDEEDDEDKSESLSREDAYWFPVMGSGVLFGLYLVFRYLNKEWVNYLLTAYFALIGVASLTKSMDAVIRYVTGIRERGYHLRLAKQSKEFFDVRFTHLQLLCAAVSSLLTLYYVYSKNWVLSNAFGISFATTAVQLIALDTFSTGMILLAGLFFYDIFWVFGTEVMVSVAKNFDAPIKVVFPKALGAVSPQFTMLGLGDIVIPGIFVALCLRFDQWLRMRGEGVKTMKSKSDFARVYYTACFTAYVLGLITTVTVMHTFQAAQPALLYLSPACILSVLLTGLVRGELATVFSFDNDAEKKQKQKEVEEAKKEKTDDAEEDSVTDGDTTNEEGKSRARKRRGKGRKQGSQ